MSDLEQYLQTLNKTDFSNETHLFHLPIKFMNIFKKYNFPIHKDVNANQITEYLERLKVLLSIDLHNKKVIDFGCNVASYLFHIESRFENIEITAYEIDKILYDICIILKNNMNSKITFVNDDFYNNKNHYDVGLLFYQHGSSFFKKYDIYHFIKQLDKIIYFCDTIYCYNIIVYNNDEFFNILNEYSE